MPLSLVPTSIWSRGLHSVISDRPVSRVGYCVRAWLTISNWKKNITKLHKEAKKQNKKKPGKTTNLY